MQRALAVAGVVGAGAAAGFVSYRLMPPRHPQPSAPVSAEEPRDANDGTRSAAPPARPVPEMLPDLSLPDLSGTSRSLRSFGARPLIVNFWATWCAPCRHEIPLLQELRRRYQPDRLEIVGVAVDFAPAVREYLQHTPIDYPLLIGEQGGLAAAEQLGMGMALPFSVFVDAQGRVVALKVGELHAEEADFILGEVRSLDAGRSDLPSARGRIEVALRELAIQRARTQQASQ